MAKDKKAKKTKKPGKATKKLKALSQNPLLADIVAAALVATAAALKDSKRARALAADAGDELAKLSRAGAERGSALWDLALEIGRRSLSTLTGDESIETAKAKSSAKRASKRPGTKKSGKAKRAGG